MQALAKETEHYACQAVRTVASGYPIVPGTGMCDPHVRCFGGRIDLCAAHDAVFKNPTHHINDWLIWRNRDLAYKPRIFRIHLIPHLCLQDISVYHIRLAEIGLALEAEIE